MHGGWTMVRMQRKPDDKRENWLLIKEIDDDAGEEPDALTDQFDVSVRTGRPMKRIAAAVGPVASAAADRKRRGKRPAFTTPQLATLVDKPPEGDDWLHETKFDGYRCLAALGGGGTRLYTRSGKDWTDRFGRLATAFDALPCDTALIDGEVMADRIRQSAFSSLQRALKEGGDLVFFAFDLLRVDGTDLTDAPLIERRERLAGLLAGLPAGGALQKVDLNGLTAR